MFDIELHAAGQSAVGSKVSSAVKEVPRAIGYRQMTPDSMAPTVHIPRSKSSANLLGLPVEILTMIGRELVEISPATRTALAQTSKAFNAVVGTESAIGIE